MKSVYGYLPDKLIVSNLNDLISQVYKLLPYKEDNYKQLDAYFSTILIRISGLSNILTDFPELLTVLSYLQTARFESDFKLYRKAILDSCSELKRMQVKIHG